VSDEKLSSEEIKRKIGVAFNSRKMAEVKRLKIILEDRDETAELEELGAAAAAEDRRLAEVAARRTQQSSDTVKVQALAFRHNEIAARIDANITGLTNDMEELQAIHLEMLQLARGIKHPLDTDSYMEMLVVAARRLVNFRGFMGRTVREEGPTMAESASVFTVRLNNELRMYLARERIACPVLMGPGTTERAAAQ